MFQYLAQSGHQQCWEMTCFASGFLWNSYSQSHITMHAGWWLVHPSEKYGPSIGMIRNPIYGKIEMFQTTNQL